MCVCAELGLELFVIWKQKGSREPAMISLPPLGRPWAQSAPNRTFITNSTWILLPTRSLVPQCKHRCTDNARIKEMMTTNTGRLLYLHLQYNYIDFQNEKREKKKLERWDSSVNRQRAWIKECFWSGSVDLVMRVCYWRGAFGGTITVVWGLQRQQGVFVLFELHSSIFLATFVLVHQAVTAKQRKLTLQTSFLLYD